MSKQSDWSSSPHPSTETILNEGRVVAADSGKVVGGVVAHHFIKTAAMWYHDYTDWRHIT